MSWSKKKPAQNITPPEDRKNAELSTPVIVAIMVAAVLVISVGLWLLVG